MTIRNELINEVLAGQDPTLVMGQECLLGELKKALLNRRMAAEFEHHLVRDRAKSGKQAGAPSSPARRDFNAV